MIVKYDLKKIIVILSNTLYDKNHVHNNNIQILQLYNFYWYDFFIEKAVKDADYGAVLIGGFESGMFR